MQNQLIQFFMADVLPLDYEKGLCFLGRVLGEQMSLLIILFQISHFFSSPPVGSNRRLLDHLPL